MSIIVESANLDRAGFAYLERMLALVDQDVADIATEVLFMDDGVADTARLESLMQSSLPLARAAGVAVRRLEQPGLTYYGLKLAGARAAVGQILLFVDSDVLPARDDAFSRLATDLLDPGIGAVGGRTSIGPGVDFRSRSFQLWWNFPLPEGTGLVEVGNYFANLFGMRAAVFAEVPLRAEAQTFRHECVEHGARLRGAGYRVVRDLDVPIWHASPPRGHVVARALEAGHDRHVRRAVEGRDRRSLPVTLGRQFVADVLRILRRVRRGRRLAGLPVWQVPGCVAWGIGYHLVVAYGHMRTATRGTAFAAQEA